MNKILMIGLIICSCQFANASGTENNRNIINNEYINYNDYYDINENINVKNSRNNVLTFANSNYKCWFVSTFQLFIAALNQSEPDSLIRKTNFAKFVNYLKGLQNDTTRRIYERGEQYKKNIQNEWNFSTTRLWKIHNLTKDRTGKNNVVGEKIDLISELIKWGTKHNWIYKKEKNNINADKIHNIQTIKKSNNKINISKYNENNTNNNEISTSKHDIQNISNIEIDNDINTTKYYKNNINISNKTNIIRYDENNNKIKNSSKADISEYNGCNETNAIAIENQKQYTNIESEKDRRNDALLLLAQIQDMNSPASVNSAILIIFSIFPELKNYFGSYLDSETNKDIIIDNDETIILNNQERINKSIDDIENNRIQFSITKCKKLTNNHLTYIRKKLHEIYLQYKNLSKRNKNKNKILNNINEVRILLNQITENNKQFDNKLDLNTKQDLIKLNRSLCRNHKNKLAKIPLSETRDNNGLSFLSRVDSIVAAHTRTLLQFKRLHNIRDIPRLKSLTFDAYKPSMGYIYLPSDNIANINKWNKNDTEYLVIPVSDTNISDISNNKYIHNKQEIYELVGICLENCEHAVSFVKIGKSDSSWSGIDSNRNANDDNYRLEDINYRDKELPQNQLVLSNSEYKKLMKEQQQNQKYYEDETNNKFLAKVYKHYDYVPKLLLYKKILLDKLQITKRQEIKDYFR